MIKSSKNDDDDNELNSSFDGINMVRVTNCSNPNDLDKANQALKRLTELVNSPNSQSSLTTENSNCEQMQDNENLAEASKSIEALLNCPIFYKLYDINKNLSSLNELNQEILELKHEETSNEEEEVYEFDYDNESDDSYAAKFVESIKKVVVYSTRNNIIQDDKSFELNQLNGGLFRVLVLRNKKFDQNYLFLVKLDNYEQNKQKRHDELWLWWLNDEESKLESNDQILNVNGVYFDNTVNFRVAYELLLGQIYSNSQVDSAGFSKKLTKFELLISRNIKRKLIKKNLKKPRIILNSYIKPSSSLSSISSASSINKNLSDSFSLFYNSRDESIHKVQSSICNNNNYNINSEFVSAETNSFSNKSQMTYKDMMVLNTEWTQLETIELLNETTSASCSNSLSIASNSLSLSTKSVSAGSAGGGGFGFGITGNKSTGVVVKAITPGGSAAKDGRLRINDQIFQIGDINVRSMSSEQVAAVLRQSSMQGQQVKFIVARPVHNTVNDIELINSEKLETTIKPESEITNANSQCFLIKTNEIIDKKVDLKKLIAGELEKPQEPTQEASTNEPINLTQENNNTIDENTNIIKTPTEIIPTNTETTKPIEESTFFKRNNSKRGGSFVNKQQKLTASMKKSKRESAIPEADYLIIDFSRCTQNTEQKTSLNIVEFLNNELADHYSIQIDSDKSDQVENGLIFYVKEKKSHTNKLDTDGLDQIELYDQLVEINSLPIENYANENNAPNFLDEFERTLGDKIKIKFFKNFKFKFKLLAQKWFNYLIKEHENNEEYNDFLNYNLDIIVSRIDKSKSKSLGISLEGTVDVDEHGVETYPHHYIRSIMSQGPVDSALDCKFKPGDELLEIDFIKLYAINYLELLDHLKSLQNKITILVCARKTRKQQNEPKMTKRAKSEGFLGLQSSSESPTDSDKLNQEAQDKIQSNENLTQLVNTINNASKSFPITKSTPIITDKLLEAQQQQQQEPPKQIRSKSSGKLIKTPQLCVRSRSLELNGLALWNKKVNYISLVKGEKGLGFSLIDYQQDPFNPLSKTMIVIRALVPNGVAQLDGRLLPGQRLVSVNEIVLDEDLLFEVDKNSRVSNSSLAKALSSNSLSKLTSSHAPAVVDLLRFTVNTLKSLPIGQVVRLGVQKPLPYPDADPSNLPSPGDSPKRTSRSTYTIFKNKSILSSSSNATTAATTPRLYKKKCHKNKKIITTSHYDLQPAEDDEENEEDDNEEEIYENEIYFEEKMHYGLVATSAPAILDQDFSSDKKYKNEKGKNQASYSFYSTSSLLKLNTINLYNQICESNSRINSKNNSTIELKLATSPRLNLKQEITEPKIEEIVEVTTSTPKSPIKSCIKTPQMNNNNNNNIIINKSFSMPFTKVAKEKHEISNLEEVENEEEESRGQISNPQGLSSDMLAKRMANSAIYFNFLLSNEHRNQQEMQELQEHQHKPQMIEQVVFNMLENENGCMNENNKQLLSEEQFNQAFILNTNKKLINLIETNRLIDNIEDEIETIEPYQEKYQNLRNLAKFDEDLNLSDQSEKTTNNAINSRNIKKVKKCRKELTEMVKDMASFKWPELNNTTNQSELITECTDNTVISKHQIDQIKEVKIKKLKFETNESLVNTIPLPPKKVKRRSRNFDEQKKYISKSRSPSAARRHNGAFESRFRSVSHGQDPNRSLATNNFYSSRGTSTTSASRNSSRSGSVKIINILGKEIIKLPSSLEKEIKIKKYFYPLGISSVDCCADEGMNGCIITKIEPNSACAKDNRLRVGDYLLSVNNEQMRNLTNASARAVLNRASLSSKDVVIIYIPLEEAVKFKASLGKVNANIVQEVTSMSQPCFTQVSKSPTSVRTSTCSLTSSLETSTPSSGQTSLHSSASESISSSIASRSQSISCSTCSTSSSSSRLSSLPSSPVRTKSKSTKINPDLHETANSKNDKRKKKEENTKIQDSPNVNIKPLESVKQLQKPRKKLQKKSPKIHSKQQHQHCIHCHHQNQSKKATDNKTETDQSSKKPTHHQHQHHQKVCQSFSKKLKKPKEKCSQEPETPIPQQTEENIQEQTIEDTSLVEQATSSLDNSAMSCGKLTDATNRSLNQSNLSNPDITSNLWGQPRIVILNREPNKSLGISIVGGKLDVCSSNNSNASGFGTVTGLLTSTSSIPQVNSFISGIFIKHVLDSSPAGLNGTLKTGDRILAVNDIDLTQATHDRAVEVIRNAKSPVKFLIQSLICINNYTPTCEEALVNENQNANEDANLVEMIEEDTEINIDPSKQVIDEDNKYNYTLECMLEKYNYLLEGKENMSDLKTNTSTTTLTEQSQQAVQSPKASSKSKLYIFKMKRNFPGESLGLSLSGNVNLNKTSVFVCGIYNDSIAQKHGLIKAGDQILEINGHVIYGRAHSNVTPLIKNLKDLDVYLVILRSSDNLTQMFKPAHNSCNSNSSGSLSPSQKSCTPLESSLVNQSSLSVQAPIALSTNSTTNESLDISSSSNTSSNTTTNLNQPTTSPLTDMNKPKQTTQTSSQAATNKLIRKIELRKGPTGFGIAISEDRYNRLIIRGLNSNGVAFQDGRMQVGDEIIAVNSIKVNTMKYDEVMNLLHQTQEPVEFQVCKPDIITACSSSVQSTAGSLFGSNNTSCTASSTTSPQAIVKQTINKPIKEVEPTKKPEPEKLVAPMPQTSQIINDDPKTNIIKVGEETWIEIERGKLGLGLSIVGGSDTQLPGIIIHDIYQNGAAFKDKRLAIGDQILKVNNVDLINATHEQALNALRQTSDFVKLLIHRGFHPSSSSSNEQFSSSSNKNSYADANSTGSAYSFTGFSAVDDEKFLNIIVVELNKKFAKGLGFSIIGRRDGTGVFISHIIEGGCAHKDGRLMIGDLILEVNGQDIRKSAYNDVAFLLKTLPQGKVTLKVGRFKTSAAVSLSNSINASANASASGSKATSRRNSNSDLTQTDGNSQARMSSNTTTFRPIIKK